MNKLFLLLLLISSTVVFAEDRGNGGGGVEREGKYMTFYTAGLYVEDQSLRKNEIPQLEELLHLLLNTKALPKELVAKYLSALRTSYKRKYYKVEEGYFSKSEYKRILTEYRKVINVQPGDDLALFAVTDISGKVTFLLPSFYQLTPAEQKAILFHEAHWLVNPNSTYEDVINVETAAQKYFEGIQNRHNFLKLLKAIKVGPNEVMKAAFELDLDSGALSNLLTFRDNEPNEILLKDLFGTDYFECIDSSYISSLSDCKTSILSYLNRLVTTEFDNSVFLELLIEKIESNKVIISSMDNVKFTKSEETIHHNFHVSADLLNKGSFLEGSFIKMLAEKNETLKLDFITGSKKWTIANNYYEQSNSDDQLYEKTRWGSLTLYFK